MNIKFLAIAMITAALIVAFKEAVNATSLKGKSMNNRGVNEITLANGRGLNGLKADNGRLKNGNEINAFTLKHGTVNGAELQSIKVEGGQLVGIQLQ
ncbi:MAG: hypothetical protein KME28_25100 [Pelatocladus maniniholoensis HA4357-MV3]|jgi:hypothetical protein|uniref:Uncharacterized protein n=1 Tax=Pelatocladus maniniholoensis HA4357-MV3 TaxID=1117104 RepID=A0A9E3HDV3_9NOST|nr:hypothetical protein [Pelatocladus maniniholoensis HA4357-MV3]